MIFYKFVFFIFILGRFSWVHSLRNQEEPTRGVESSSPGSEVQTTPGLEAKNTGDSEEQKKKEEEREKEKKETDPATLPDDPSKNPAEVPPKAPLEENLVEASQNLARSESTEEPNTVVGPSGPTGQVTGDAVQSSPVARQTSDPKVLNQEQNLQKKTEEAPPSSPSAREGSQNSNPTSTTDNSPPKVQEVGPNPGNAGTHNLPSRTTEREINPLPETGSRTTSTTANNNGNTNQNPREPPRETTVRGETVQVPITPVVTETNDVSNRRSRRTPRSTGSRSNNVSETDSDKEPKVKEVLVTTLKQLQDNLKLVNTTELTPTSKGVSDKSLCKTVKENDTNVCVTNGKPGANELLALVNTYYRNNVCTTENSMNQLYNDGGFSYKLLENHLSQFNKKAPNKNAQNVYDKSVPVVTKLKDLLKDAELALVSDDVKKLMKKRYMILTASLCGVATDNQDVMSSAEFNSGEVTLTLNEEDFVSESTATLLKAYEPMVELLKGFNVLLPKLLDLFEEGFENKINLLTTAAHLSTLEQPETTNAGRANSEAGAGASTRGSVSSQNQQGSAGTPQSPSPSRTAPPSDANSRTPGKPGSETLSPAPGAGSRASGSGPSNVSTGYVVSTGSGGTSTGKSVGGGPSKPVGDEGQQNSRGPAGTQGNEAQGAAGAPGNVKGSETQAQAGGGSGERGAEASTLQLIDFRNKIVAAVHGHPSLIQKIRSLLQLREVSNAGPKEAAPTSPKEPGTPGNDKRQQAQSQVREGQPGPQLPVSQGDSASNNEGGAPGPKVDVTKLDGLEVLNRTTTGGVNNSDHSQQRGATHGLGGVGGAGGESTPALRPADELPEPQANSDTSFDFFTRLKNKLKSVVSKKEAESNATEAQSQKAAEEPSHKRNEEIDDELLRAAFQNFHELGLFKVKGGKLVEELDEQRVKTMIRSSLLTLNDYEAMYNLVIGAQRSLHSLYEFVEHLLLSPEADERITNLNDETLLDQINKMISPLEDLYEQIKAKSPFLRLKVPDLTPTSGRDVPSQPRRHVQHVTPDRPNFNIVSNSSGVKISEDMLGKSAQAKKNLTNKEANKGKVASTSFIFLTSVLIVLKFL